MRPSARLRALALVALAPSAALAAEQAGVSAAVRGEVVLARAQAAGNPVRSGEPVFMQDMLRSGPRSGMQLMLLDETTFTIGPESEIVVDEFVYDPQTGSGALGARVVKGVFRFVTGRIAKTDSGNVNVALPSGNIGVRGTIVAGTADPVTRSSLVVLLGEGADNEAGDEPGSIDVCNAGACVEVTRPGFGVRIDGPEFRPSQAFRVDVPAVQALLQDVNDPGGVQDALATSDADESVTPPRDRIDPAERRQAKNARKELHRLDEDDELTNLASQDAIAQREIDTLKEFRLAGVPNGPTSYDQLRSLSFGAIHYAANGVPLGSGGSYDFLLNVDLGAQTFGGGGSFLQVNGARNGTQPLANTVSYAGDQGLANFHIYTNSIVGAGCVSNCSGDLAVLPQNANGKIASEALHSLRVYDAGGSQIDYGQGTTAAMPGFQP